MTIGIKIHDALCRQTTVEALLALAAGWAHAECVALCFVGGEGLVGCYMLVFA